jgi:hypothetical protein
MAANGNDWGLEDKLKRGEEGGEKRKMMRGRVMREWGGGGGEEKEGNKGEGR